MLAFRESSEPEYPGAKLDTFDSVIREAMGGAAPRRAGIAGYSLISHVIYQQFEAALKSLGNEEILHADEIVSQQRVKKSTNEIACLREAYRITQEAMKAVLANIRPGMTENQVKGIALSKIFSEGGEGEAYPFWILTGEGSNQAISRCRNRVIRQGDMMQIQVGRPLSGLCLNDGPRGGVRQGDRRSAQDDRGFA